jgi:hypothetical protein
MLLLDVVAGADEAQELVERSATLAAVQDDDDAGLVAVAAMHPHLVGRPRILRVPDTALDLRRRAAAAAPRVGTPFPLFARIAARDYHELHGNGRDYGTHLGHMNGDARVCYRIDLGPTGATAMMARTGVPAGRTDCRVQVRLDAPDGPVVGDAKLTPTGGDGLATDLWQEVPLKPANGVRKVYLVPPLGCGSTGTTRSRASRTRPRGSGAWTGGTGRGSASSTFAGASHG